MLDVNGSAINATQLSSNIVDYSAVSSTSYASFPGGFSPSNIVDEGGNPVNGGHPVNFVSAGLISIKMTAGATPVRHFSKPLSVSMKLDPNTTNLTTGANIQAGDVVPLWSLTEETGQWRSEGNITITADGSGDLVANFQTTHLCCFNLDWYWYSTCNVPLKITFHCTPGRAGIYEVYIVTPNNQYLAGAHSTYVANGQSIVFPYLPEIAQCKVIISNFTPALTLLGQTTLFNPCIQGAIDCDFTAPPASVFMNVTLKITARCSNQNVNILPSGWFYIHDDSDVPNTFYRWVRVYVSNGVITYLYGIPVSGISGAYNITLVRNHKYHICTNTDGTWYQSSEFTMASKNFTYSNSSGLSCNGIYDIGSNSMNITATYSVHCH
jgi:hypothetical protein